MSICQAICCWCLRKIILTVTNGSIAVIALKQEQKALRPTFPNAYDYYFDYYSKEEEHTFRLTKDTWENICRSNDPSHRLTETELKLVSLVSTLIERSPLGLAYFSLEYLCTKLNITDRQLRTVRKNTNHIFLSSWRKATRINGALKKNVYVFAYTPQGRSMISASTKNHFAKISKMVDIKLNIQKKVQDFHLSTKHYESVKLGSPLPTSIYKDDKYIKDRSSKSIVLQKSSPLILEDIVEQKEIPKLIPLKPKPIGNKRKKPTNGQIKAKKAKLYKFNQYEQPKSLNEHYPLSKDDCAKLQIASGREFTLNAMNEILLDISRKPKESKHLFPSKAAFIAYMSKVYSYEGRDAVKTANLGFKLLARATEAEVIAYTTQTQRDDFMATFEETAINHPTPENRFKAKIACTLPPMIGYNLLSGIKSVLFSGNTLEIHLANQLDIDHHKQAILKEARAVDSKINALAICFN